MVATCDTSGCIFNLGHLIKHSFEYVGGVS